MNQVNVPPMTNPRPQPRPICEDIGQRSTIFRPKYLYVKVTFFDFFFKSGRPIQKDRNGFDPNVSPSAAQVQPSAPKYSSIRESPPSDETVTDRPNYLATYHNETYDNKV